MTAQRSPAIAITVGAAVAAFAIYMASAAAALHWTRDSTLIAAVWPSNALVAGFVLHRGRKQLGAMMAGMVVASLLATHLFGFPIATVLGFSLAAAVEVLVVVLVLGKDRPESSATIASVPDFVRFLLIAAGLAPAIGSMIAGLTAHMAMAAPLGSFIAQWYLGAACGAVLFLTPFLLSFPDSKRRIGYTTRPDRIAAVVGIAGLCATAFVLPSPYHLILSLGFFVWLGYRFGAFATSLAGILVAIPWLVGHYTGQHVAAPEASGFPERPLDLQATIAGAIAVSIATVLALRERDETRKDLTIARLQLKEMESLASGATFQLEIREGRPARMIYGASDLQFAGALGLGSMPSRFAEFLAHVHDADRPSLSEAVADAIRSVTACNTQFRWPSKGEVRWLRLVALPKTTAAGETVFDGVLLDATDKVEGDELKRRQTEQAALVTARSSFLAAASHDLRQPLHVLGLYLHTLERRLRDPQDIEIVRSMKTASSAMSEMFTALLDLAKIESGTLKPRMTTVSIDALLQEALNEILTNQGTRRDRIRLVKSSLFVETDPILLKMVLRNLITNALKYAPKGRVLVGVRRGKDGLRVVIGDRGPGIEPQDAPRIFEDFYRGSSGRSTPMQGIGLGLAIAKRTADLLGATLTFSTTAGRGACFQVGLARVEPGEVGEPASRLQEPKAHVRAGGERLLVVEDDPAVAASLTSMLREAGFAPVVATSGRDAMPLIDRGIDGAIIDYQLPGMISGLDLADHIRTIGRSGTPILLVSGRTDTETVRRFDQAGLRWLAKPVAGERLISALIDLLDAKNQARSARSP